MSISLWVQWTRGWWWWVLRVTGFSHTHTLGDFGQPHPILSAGLPQGEDAREPGEIRGEGCELYRPLGTPPYSAPLNFLWPHLHSPPLTCPSLAPCAAAAEPHEGGGEGLPGHQQ